MKDKWDDKIGMFFKKFYKNNYNYNINYYRTNYNIITF